MDIDQVLCQVHDRVDDYFYENVNAYCIWTELWDILFLMDRVIGSGIFYSNCPSILLLGVVHVFGREFVDFFVICCS